jgi:hypothetical protein
MKNLVLGSLIAIAASGCIIESGDSCPVESGNVTANWTIRHEASGTSVSCPAGYTTAALYTQPANADGTLVAGSQPTIDLFDCDCNSGTTNLAPGLYLAWIEIANDNNTAKFAQSASAFLDLTNGGPVSFNAQIIEDGGYFMLKWDLVGKQSNQFLSCAQAGAAGGVSVIGTEINNATNSAEDQFDCEDQQGITAGYVQGNYTVAVTALNASDASIGETQTKTATIGDRNSFTDLGKVTIPIIGL